MAGIPFCVKPLPFTVPMVSSEVAGYYGTHTAEFDYISMIWRTASITASSAVIQCDLGSAQGVNFVAMLCTNAQSGSQMKFVMDDTQANIGGGSEQYSSGFVPIISPSVSGRDSYHSFLDIGSTQTRRYFGIIIASHTGAFECAKIIVGTKVQPAKYYETQWETGIEDMSRVDLGRNGVPLIAAGASYRTLDFTLGWMTESEKETMFDPLDKALGIRKPALWMFDPDATTYRQNRTFFGRYATAPKIGKQGYNRFEKRVSLLSMI